MSRGNSPGPTHTAQTLIQAQSQQHKPFREGPYTPPRACGFPQFGLGRARVGTAGRVCGVSRGPCSQLTAIQHPRASGVWSFLSFPFLCQKETQSPLSPWPGPLLPNAAESRRSGRGGDEGPHHQAWKGAAEELHGRGGQRAPLLTRQDRLRWQGPLGKDHLPGAQYGITAEESDPDFPLQNLQSQQDGATATHALSALVCFSIS